MLLALRFQRTTTSRSQYAGLPEGTDRKQTAKHCTLLGPEGPGSTVDRASRKRLSRSGADDSLDLFVTALMGWRGLVPPVI